MTSSHWPVVTERPSMTIEYSIGISFVRIGVRGADVAQPRGAGTAGGRRCGPPRRRPSGCGASGAERARWKVLGADRIDDRRPELAGRVDAYEVGAEPLHHGDRGRIGPVGADPHAREPD